MTCFIDICELINIYIFVLLFHQGYFLACLSIQRQTKHEIVIQGLCSYERIYSSSSSNLLLYMNLSSYVCILVIFCFSYYLLCSPPVLWLSLFCLSNDLSHLLSILFMFSSIYFLSLFSYFSFISFSIFTVFFLLPHLVILLLSSLLYLLFLPSLLFSWICRSQLLSREPRLRECHH